MNSGFLRVCTIVRGHGVSGAVKVVPLTDDPHRFLTLQTAYLEEKGAYRPINITGAKLLSDGSAALTIEGVTTREAAERLRNAFIAVDRAHAVKLPENAYFVADLIGCETFDTNGKRLGKITDVLETGANDVYEIDGGKLLVPALKKVLAEVDTESCRIVFHADVLSEVGLYAN